MFACLGGAPTGIKREKSGTHRLQAVPASFSTNDLICPICNQVFDRPYIAPCGHSFCAECISKYVSAATAEIKAAIGAPNERRPSLLPKVHCPLDERELSTEKLKRNDQLYEVINSISRVCMNAPSGCKWVGEQKELSAHLETECKYRKVFCGNNGCPYGINQSKSLETRHASKHAMECKFRQTVTDLSETFASDVRMAILREEALALHGKANADFYMMMSKAYFDEKRYGNSYASARMAESLDPLDRYPKANELARTARVHYRVQQSTTHELTFIHFAEKLQTANFELPRSVMMRHIAEVCCGARHVLAVTAYGVVMAWGDNSQCQLGTASPASTFNNPFPRRAIFAKELSAAADYSAIVTVEGSVYEWGTNYFGERIEKPRPLEGLLHEGVIALKLSPDHYMALCISGNVYLWGSNAYGQCGQQNTLADVETPERVPGLAHLQVTDIRVRGHHSAILTCYGDIYAFGSNEKRQLGPGCKGQFSWEPVRLRLPKSGVWKALGVSASTRFIDFYLTINSTIALAEGGVVLRIGGVDYSKGGSDAIQIISIDTNENARVLRVYGSSTQTILLDEHEYLWEAPFTAGEPTATLAQRVITPNRAQASCVDINDYQSVIVTGFHTFRLSSHLQSIRSASPPTGDLLVQSTDGSELIAHSCMLTPHSRNLSRTLGQGGITSMRFDAPGPVVEAFLTYVYSGVLHVPYHLKADFLSLAKDYDMKNLVSILERFDFKGGMYGWVIPSLPMDYMLSSHVLSDVVLFLNEGSQVSCHSIILGSRSEYWKKKFSGVDRKRHPTIKMNVDAGLTAMNIVLNFIYTGYFKYAENDVQVLVEAIELGEKYLIPALRLHCEERILDTVTSSTQVSVQNALSGSHVELSDYFKFQFEQRVSRKTLTHASSIAKMKMDKKREKILRKHDKKSKGRVRRALGFLLLG